MHASGARLEFDSTLWAQWDNVHAWVDSGRVLAEPINDRAVVTVFDCWGRPVARCRFRKGQWRQEEGNGALEEIDLSAAARVSPAHAANASPALALAAEIYCAQRPIRTPILPGDEQLPREDSAIVQHLIRGAIAVVLAGWLLVWLGWVAYVIWKVWARLHTGVWPMLTLHDVGFRFRAPWAPVQMVVDTVLHLGLGWTFLLAGTAVYVVAGGTVLFVLFTAIKLVEALVRAMYSALTAGTHPTQ